ncbi:hypothetical protein EDC94DRAFT_580999 [Helicostylum pulchrum]|nr:hypothetical protein EDC94DRAFT_580999 [Helicostylum pulchrum]
MVYGHLGILKRKEGHKFNMLEAYRSSDMYILSITATVYTDQLQIRIHRKSAKLIMFKRTHHMLIMVYPANHLVLIKKKTNHRKTTRTEIPGLVVYMKIISFTYLYIYRDEHLNLQDQKVSLINLVQPKLYPIAIRNLHVPEFAMIQKMVQNQGSDKHARFLKICYKIDLAKDERTMLISGIDHITGHCFTKDILQDINAFISAIVARFKLCLAFGREIF